MRIDRHLVVLGLVVAVMSCADEATAPSAEEPSTTATAASTTEPSTEPTTIEPAATTTEPAATTTAPPTTSVTTTSEPAPAQVEVAVYFFRDERLMTELREVPGPAVLRGALEELLAGPAGDDPDVGSAIPVGTELLDLALADGIARVDLSAAFESGGGSSSMTGRVAQIVFTATRFPNVDAVTFLLEGEPIAALGGEGLELLEPQDRTSVDRSLSGAVIIDTPRPGDTVTSPFVVTGEGDVFEGQFPIEVWAGDQMVGGVAPVTAGAWGEWATFEVTVDVDAPPGPIELRAYDAGGCGDDPECPEIIVTAVPLRLVG